MGNVIAGTATATAALSQASTLIGSLTGLLLASPQTTQGYVPMNPPGAGGFLSSFFNPPGILFHYEGEQTVSLQSDITDHFLENNTSIQDQIALKPIIITTHGFIGELNNVPPKALGILSQAANTLTTIGSYVPGLSVTAQNAYNEAFAAYQIASSAVNAGVSAVSSLTGGGGASVVGTGGAFTKVPNQNLQQGYFQQFYGYWNNRVLFTVQTPWAIFQNMAILNLRAIQDETTRMITDFEVTFKQINTANTNLSTLGAQGRLASQASSLVSSGTGSTSPAAGSLASGVARQQGSP